MTNLSCSFQNETPFIQLTEDSLNYHSETHICMSVSLFVCSSKYIFSSLYKQVTDQIEALEEASKHMEVAMKLFKTYEETADADPSMVTDQYLDPLHLMLEMPDMSRLEKPAKPPMPSLVRLNKAQIKLVFILAR